MFRFGFTVLALLMIAMPMYFIEGNIKGGLSWLFPPLLLILWLLPPFSSKQAIRDEYKKIHLFIPLSVVFALYLCVFCWLWMKGVLWNEKRMPIEEIASGFVLIFVAILFSFRRGYGYSSLSREADKRASHLAISSVFLGLVFFSYGIWLTGFWQWSQLTGQPPTSWHLIHPVYVSIFSSVASVIAFQLGVKRSTNGEINEL